MRTLLLAALLLTPAAPALCAPAVSDLEEGAAKAYAAGDYVSAATLWSKAAKKGSAEARFELARLYAEGKGVPFDLLRALDLFRDSARQGHAEAQYNLGQMYAHGFGVRKNASEGLAWYEKAAAQGHEKAAAAVVWLRADIAHPSKKAPPPGDSPFVFGAFGWMVMILALTLPVLLILTGKTWRRRIADWIIEKMGSNRFTRFLLGILEERAQRKLPRVESMGSEALIGFFGKAGALSARLAFEVVRRRKLPLKTWTGIYGQPGSKAISEEIIALVLKFFPDDSGAREFFLKILKGRKETILTQAAAAKALGAMKSDETLPGLEEAADHSQGLGTVRRAAVDAIAATGSDAAFRLLAKLLCSRDVEVQIAAEDAIPRAASEKLITILHEALNSHTDRDHGQVLLRTIVVIERRRKEAGKPLASKKAFLDTLMRYPTGWVGGEAAEALGEFRVVESLQPLIEALSTMDSNIRYKAVIALGELRRKEALPRLKELVDEEVVPEIRGAVIDVIARLEGEADSAEA